MLDVKDDIPFALKQMAACLDLAKTCGDEEISRRLHDLAQAFSDFATRHGADTERHHPSRVRLEAALRHRAS